MILGVLGRMCWVEMVCIRVWFQVVLVGFLGRGVWVKPVGVGWLGKNVYHVLTRPVRWFEPLLSKNMHELLG